MEKQELIKQYENDLLSKVMGFCYMKLTNREDAEDLASEISVEVLKTIQSGKHIENLNALVWSISNHIFCKRLRSKKYSNTVYLDELYPADDDPEKECILKEQISILRREIALLSENYRRSVVMYYFENRNCDEIALALHKSPGTIKWWLHEARKQMKEGFSIMREYGEKSFNPGKLCMSCQGLPGADNEPMCLAKRALPQNILLAAYKEPITVEELCAELGTPAAYIEDELSALVEGGLMITLSGGKFQTDFVILPGQNIKTANKIYEACFPEYFTLLMDFLEKHRSELADKRFNTAGFSWDRLLWVYIHIFTDTMLSKYKHEECDFVTYPNMPIRPNGGKWIALSFENGYFSDNLSNSAPWYVPFDGPVHKIGKEFAQGYFHYWSGLDSNVFFDIPEGVFALCRDIIRRNLSRSTISCFPKTERF